MQNRPDFIESHSARPAQKVRQEIIDVHQSAARPAGSQTEEFVQTDLRNFPVR